MPITPLPQFEADLAEQDREIYERLKPPSSVVVRFGVMKMIGEFPYSGDVKPGCGSKLVVKTHRGTELGEMLTSTCPNAGCSKSVTRQEMLQYIENSGGREYPFFSMQGRVLRIATVEDLNQQAAIESQRPQLVRSTRALAERLGMTNMKVVDAEPILGGEKLTFYFTSEDRVDFRELVEELAKIHGTRIEMRQVGARDEARLVADYERCGQHCCCKQFLKVLKPISMKSAKIQKATLDPLKISGRCGRLMCCLRYEDETYDHLRARLPKKKTRVKTSDGWGLVLDTQILTQLVLVQLDSNYEQVAIPLEELELATPANPAPPVPPHPSMREGGPRGAGMGAGGAPARDGRDGRGGERGRGGGDRPARSERGRDGRGPSGGGGPEGGAGRGPGQGAARPPKPPERQTDEVDDLMNEVFGIDDIETDVGDDGPVDGRRERPRGGGPGAGGGGRRRRKRRRGRGSGGGGDGGAGGGNPGGGSPIRDG
jgi:cell fate regulator YaaT (PSP1 superfamily)